ncbi:Nif11-like leader peptide family natural product precursor [Synechococcus sp. 8F6]|uniref:Nif11-like leader peptide family natural product precursor n=1 Tax=Synechococcus sp. 8F6 TaxID=2025606 RepID=UPI0013038D4C|nr:Nif11-like leader peptide family natural product precursor [Synechococcus sp. 8F6]
MNGASELKRFIEHKKKDPALAAQLAQFGVDQWGEAHLPLDIDIHKLIELARLHGFHFDESDVFKSQCEHLQSFWMFEMENSFVARRYMARIQLHIDKGNTRLSEIDYYN